MSTPAPELRKCLHCPVNLQLVSDEARTAMILCRAATDEFFFEDHGLDCLAMMLFVERKLRLPTSARQLQNRMKELREPLS